MGIRFVIIAVIFLGISLSAPVWAQNLSNIPVPGFKNAGVGAEVAYVSETGHYIYEAKGLLFYNTQYLKDKRPDTHIPLLKSSQLLLRGEPKTLVYHFREAGYLKMLTFIN